MSSHIKNNLLRMLAALAAVILIIAVLPSCRREINPEDDKLFVRLVGDEERRALTEDNYLVGFYDRDGARHGYSFTQGTGEDAVSCPAGTYDIMVYSLGSQSTRIQDEGSWETAKAATTEVKVEIRNNFKTAKTILATYVAAMGVSPATTKAGFENDAVVVQPDPMWSFARRDNDIPLRAREDAGGYSVTVPVDDVTRNGHISIRIDGGAEWVRGGYAYLSNLARYRYLADERACKEAASVYIPLNREGNSDVLEASFRCFGIMEDHYENTIYLVISDVMGTQHLFAFNVTTQVRASGDGDIDIDLSEKEIIISEPADFGNQDAFRPYIKNWSEEFVDVPIGQGKNKEK